MALQTVPTQNEEELKWIEFTPKRKEEKEWDIMALYSNHLYPHKKLSKMKRKKKSFLGGLANT